MHREFGFFGQLSDVGREGLAERAQPTVLVRDKGDHLGGVLFNASSVELGLADGDWATCESRRGSTTLKCSVVTTIRPDTVFIPYHWAGKKSANQLTISAQDPYSKIPEYKVCACRVRKAERPEYADRLEPQQ